MIPRYSRPEMAAIWSDEARFALWLEIETLALEAMVNDGRAPKEALDEVKKKGAFSVDRVLEIENEVKHDVIAFLTNVAENVGEGARWLHLGMTSSDLLDTCLAAQLTRATDIILNGVDRLLAALKTRAEEHKNTVCIGRSHGIHAEPVTMGLKFASFYAEINRQKTRLLAAREDIAVGAISGPVGTYAHLSPKVEEHVCKALGLKPATISSQVIPRDSHAALFLALAQLGTSLERIVVEVRHLQRTEVREAEEFFSKGQKGSSAMPHKRNPILSENVTGLARLLRSWGQASLENVALWHERDISHSSVERVIAPDATVALDFALHRVAGMVEKLVVYPENLQRNLDLTNGLIFSGALLVVLAEKGLSREEAYKLVQGHAMATWDEINQTGTSGTPFQERVLADAKIKEILSDNELSDVFSLDRHTAHVSEIFRRVFTETT